MTPASRPNAPFDVVSAASRALDLLAEQVLEREAPEEIAAVLSELFLPHGPGHRLAHLLRDAGIALHRTQLPDRQALAGELLSASTELTKAVLRLGELGVEIEYAVNAQYPRSQAATSSSPNLQHTGPGPVAHGTGLASSPAAVPAPDRGHRH